MSSIMLGADAATQAAIAAKYSFPKVDRSKPIPMVVKKADGTAVQIDDPAKQQEFIARSAVKAPDMVLDEMIAEAKAKPKAAIPLVAIIGAAVAAFFLFR